MPWKSTTTTGSLPTTQASRPVGSSDTSPALHSRVVPSSITTFIVPEIWYWKCGASQLVVFAIGFTWVDHFKPGSKVPRPMVTPPILTTSPRPFSNVRTSSGAPNPLTSIVAISPPPLFSRFLNSRDTLLLLIQAPHPSAAAGDEEKHERVEGRQLAFVDGREKRRAELELPVKLEIRHGHLAAAEKRRPAGLKAHQDQQAANQLDESAEPQLGSHRRLELTEKPQNLLGAVKGEHEPRNDAQQR